MSVIARIAFAHSSAVEASKPRVLLSQQKIEPLVAMHSIMETRFRSPPETPRTNSFPTLVSSVCDIFIESIRNFLKLPAQSEGETLPGT